MRHIFMQKNELGNVAVSIFLSLQVLKAERLGIADAIASIVYNELH